ncbi:MAG: helix-turn-helix transcriptional regulator [Xenococcaceae cyanobacterium MO_234.B1]|nr:helix-turn-helix transcriptional regulator [Xenococcaceae cyanobacterium MO_234.B1]
MPHQLTNLLNRRKELGLTQRKIAEAIGVTVQTVSNWETGLYEPKLTIGQLDKLCQILEVDVRELKELFTL